MPTNATALRGSPAYAAGKFGDAMSGGVLQVSSSLDFGTAGTFALWVKTTSTSSGRMAAFGNDGAGAPTGYWVGMKAGVANMNVYGYDGSMRPGVTATAINDGGWHYLELGCDGSYVHFFVDGVFYQAYPVVRDFGPGVTAIGGYGATADSDWVGQIDEVHVSSVCEHTASYAPPAAPLANNAANLVSLYHLEADGTDSVPAAPSTVNYQQNFDSLAAGAAPGWAGFAGAAFAVGTVNPVSGAHSFGTPAPANNQVELLTGVAAMSDGDVVFSQKIVGDGGGIAAVGAVLRANAGYTQGYVTAIGANGGALFSFNGAYNVLTGHALSFTPAAGQTVWQRFRVVGTTLYWRVWQGGAAEPTTWDLQKPDATFAGPGYAGLYVGDSTSGHPALAVDDVTVTSFDAQAAPAAPTLTLAPASQSVADGASASLTATLSNASGALSVGTSGGGTVSTITPVSGTPFTLTTPGTGSGTVTVTVTGPGGLSATATVAYAAAAPAPAQPANTFAAPNAGFAYYGRWNLTASEAVTINCGSLIEFGYTGDLCTLAFDLTGVAVPPEVVTQVDGLAPVRTALSSTVTSVTLAPLYTSTTAVAAHAHRVRVWAAGVFEGVGPPESATNQWASQAAAVKFQGVTLNAGESLLVHDGDPNIIEFLGDSITASVRLHYTGSASDQTVMDGSNSWPAMTAGLLGLKPRVVGFGGTGLTTGGSGSVPASGQTLNYVYGGVPWNPAVKPAVVVIYLGTNDAGASAAAFQSAYSAYLQGVRASYPNAVIFAVTPAACAAFDPAIAAAVTAANDTKTVHLNYSGATVYGPSDAVDGTHPNPGGAAKLAARLAADVQSNLNALGVAYQSATAGGSTPTPATGFTVLVPAAVDGQPTEAVAVLTGGAALSATLVVTIADPQGTFAAPISIPNGQTYGVTTCTLTGAGNHSLAVTDAGGNGGMTGAGSYTVPVSATPQAAQPVGLTANQVQAACAAALAATPVNLAATGLDAVSVTPRAGVAATLPQMVVQTWRRFYKVSSVTATQMRTYADDGQTVLTTQNLSDDGVTQAIGGAV